jgi:hypothetical protein
MESLQLSRWYFRRHFSPPVGAIADDDSLHGSPEIARLTRDYQGQGDSSHDGNGDYDQSPNCLRNLVQPSSTQIDQGRNGKDSVDEHQK